MMDSECELNVYAKGCRAVGRAARRQRRPSTLLYCYVTELD